MAGKMSGMTAKALAVPNSQPSSPSVQLKPFKASSVLSATEMRSSRTSLPSARYGRTLTLLLKKNKGNASVSARWSLEQFLCLFCKIVVSCY